MINLKLWFCKKVLSSYTQSTVAVQRCVLIIVPIVGPGGALSKNTPPGSTKKSRFRGQFGVVSTPEWYLKIGVLLSEHGVKRVCNED